MNDPFLMKVEDYLDGLLSPAESALFTAHLEDCPACREELEICRRVRRLARAAPPVRIPADLGERIRHRMRTGVSRERKAGGRVLALRWVAAAAAAAVLLLVIFPSFQRPVQEGIPAEPMPVAVASDNSLDDWFEQARNSEPGDALFLIEEARESDLLAKVRMDLSRTRGRARTRLLAMEDFLIQIANEPDPEFLAGEARLVAMAGR